jgi:hypothetical protein
VVVVAVAACKGNVRDISVLVFCTVHCAFDWGAKKLITFQTFYIYILITVFCSAVRSCYWLFLIRLSSSFASE